MKIPRFYFDWLQKGNPTGTVERFPELKEGFETSVPGIYCIGDLTGIPLIKLASESGFELMEKLEAAKAFQEERRKNDGGDTLDLVIAGAGPAGIAAGLRAMELGYRFVIFESSHCFNTISNFPKGKPIYVSPEGPMKSGLRFSDGTKESLLEELKTGIEGKDLPVREGEMVQTIVKEKSGFTVETVKGAYKALRVVVAIGKSGNARTLGIPGEKMPKVFNRLIDPGDHADQDILVVGGGDSAVEAAVALARTGNRVALSYRKTSLSRPKEPNLLAFEEEVNKGRITPMFESQPKEITERSAILSTKEGDKEIPNHAVYTLIGTEIPIRFFQRSRIRMEGEMRFPDYVALAALLLFSGLLYFGKTAPQTPIQSVGEFFTLPSLLWGQSWVYFLKGMLAWISFLGMAVTGLYLLYHLLKNVGIYLNGPWPVIKYGYYMAMFVLFGFLYVMHALRGETLLGWTMDNWYTAAYAMTILIFGLRRMYVKPSGYIIRQTWTLTLIQWVPLFILPVIVLPILGKNGWLPDWVMVHVFPNESYWRAFGLILAWPLFIWNLASGEPFLFWLIVSLVQSFVIIPYIIYRWGKGAYCGWICSCGALAETLGDEYRTKAPHGPRAKRMDNWGQVVLWFAGILTVLVISGTWFGKYFGITPFVQDLYSVVVDIIFAGVLGVGVYFFMSGRVWCRFLCPLAALMHIYARFTVYRIFSNKKRCISCNICTRVCHMGIDVMGFANKGIPMNDVECVRCSACVVNCPMDVLYFGTVSGKNHHDSSGLPIPNGWQSGLPQDRLEKLKGSG
jgi:thioredoxin reductase/NAD-dependent dihydropyrimidine dehydrogenase PreA subunit